MVIFETKPQYFAEFWEISENFMVKTKTEDQGI